MEDSPAEPGTYGFTTALVAIARDGGLAAVGSFVPLALLGGLFFAVAAVSSILICVTFPIVIVFAALGLAAAMAGPLAAFSLAASGSPVGVAAALERGASRLHLLAALYVLLVSATLGVELPVALSAFAAGGSGPLCLQVIALPAIAYVHARWFTLAQVLAVADDRAGWWPDFARVDELARGRLPILLLAVVAPYAVIVLAQPAGMTADVLGQANAHRLAVLAGFAGWLLSFLVGALFSTAAWAVATKRPAALRAEGS